LVEHSLGKGEVVGPTPTAGSRFEDERWNDMKFWTAKELAPFLVLAAILAGIGMVYELVVLIDKYEQWQKRRRAKKAKDRSR
jgi:hypothetical protein